MLISSNGLKRKSSSIEKNNPMNKNSLTQIIPTKRFRATDCDGRNIDSMSTLKTIDNHHSSSKTTTMISEYRQLQYELQCQEALLVLMQKLKTNQRLISQTKQRTSTTTPINATKLNSVTPNKPSTISTNRSTASIPTQAAVKTPHPNQYTVNRSNVNSQSQSSKNSQPLPQATRQTNNTTLPATATRLSSTVPTTATKTSSSSSSSPATNPTNSKNNGINNDQHLLSAKLALRKQLEQTLLQIPTPKPTTCDLTYIPGINGWAEFLTLIGLEQAFNTYTDFLQRRLTPELSINLPHVCAQCNTDWSVTWHEVISTNENESEEKILCDRCRKTSQKKILKQDHSNRLRQAFMKALQQEKELDAKFQQQTPSSSTAIKQSSSSSSLTSHSKHSSKPVSTKLNSNHQSSKHTNHHHQHHHHHHSSKSSKTLPPTSAPPPPPVLNPADAFASTLAALPTNEQIELFQKHFLSNMFPLAFANQAVALASKSTQQQQQALAASFPAMAASLMRQSNPAQYLLDMIPQAAKQQQQQQQQHHRHSK